MEKRYSVCWGGEKEFEVDNENESDNEDEAEAKFLKYWDSLSEEDKKGCIDIREISEKDYTKKKFSEKEMEEERLRRIAVPNEVSKEVIEELMKLNEDKRDELLKKAAKRAEMNGRRTVYVRDL